MAIICEDDIINAICLSQAYHNDVALEQVEVELGYDEEQYSAEVFLPGKSIMLDAGDMVGALRMWVKEQMHMDPFASRIQLQFNENDGIYATVES